MSLAFHHKKCSDIKRKFGQFIIGPHQVLTK